MEKQTKNPQVLKWNCMRRHWDFLTPLSLYIVKSNLHLGDRNVHFDPHTESLNVKTIKHSPSRSSSKSSTKNSRNGGRLGLFRVLTSCWIFAETLLLTGTPVEHQHTLIKDLPSADPDASSVTFGCIPELQLYIWLLQQNLLWTWQEP